MRAAWQRRCGGGVLFWAVAAFAGCRVAAPPERVASVEESWSFESAQGAKIVTDHFDIYTTLTDAGLKEALPAFLEAAHAQYVALLPPPRTGSSRLQTYVFDNRLQWERFSRRRFPSRFGVYRRISAGGFSEGSLCVVYYILRPYTLSILAHEGMHQYFANHFQVMLPAWLNEGLACYCESFELAGSRPVFTPKSNSFRLNALREALTTQSLLPLRVLLATDAGQVVVQGRSQLTKTYYSQAWAMIVFIRHGPGGRYAKGMERLLGDVVSGELPQIARAARIRAPSPSETSFGESVFRAYITEDLDGFDRDFRDYMGVLAGFR